MKEQATNPDKVTPGNIGQNTANEQSTLELFINRLQQLTDRQWTLKQRIETIANRVYGEVPEVSADSSVVANSPEKVTPSSAVDHLHYQIERLEDITQSISNQIDRLAAL